MHKDNSSVKGEIATILMFGALVLFGISAIASSIVNPRRTVNTKASETECKNVIQSLSFNKDTFECIIIASSGRDVVCGIRNSPDSWPSNCPWVSGLKFQCPKEAFAGVPKIYVGALYNKEGTPCYNAWNSANAMWQEYELGSPNTQQTSSSSAPTSTPTSSAIPSLTPYPSATQTPGGPPQATEAPEPTGDRNPSPSASPTAPPLPSPTNGNSYPTPTGQIVTPSPTTTHPTTIASPTMVQPPTAIPTQPPPPTMPAQPSPTTKAPESSTVNINLVLSINRSCALAYIKSYILELYNNANNQMIFQSEAFTASFKGDDSDKSKTYSKSITLPAGTTNIKIKTTYVVGLSEGIDKSDMTTYGPIIDETVKNTQPAVTIAISNGGIQCNILPLAISSSSYDTAYISQQNPSWIQGANKPEGCQNRTVANSGCGPTSAAMLLNNQSVTPVTLWNKLVPGKFYCGNIPGFDGGSSISPADLPGVMKEMGFQAELVAYSSPYDVRDIRAQREFKQQMARYINAGWGIIANTTQYNGDHFVVVSQLRPDGNVDLYDPYDSSGKAPMAFLGDPNRGLFRYAFIIAKR